MFFFLIRALSYPDQVASSYKGATQTTGLLSLDKRYIPKYTDGGKYPRRLASCSCRAEDGMLWPYKLALNEMM